MCVSVQPPAPLAGKEKTPNIGIFLLTSKRIESKKKKWIEQWVAWACVRTGEGFIKRLNMQPLYNFVCEGAAI